MYGIPVTARHEVRRIAGRIVPAIATTTAAVAGLVSLELVKLIAARVRPDFGPDTSSTVTKSPHGGADARNAFLNLALPLILLSEPGPCARTRLPNGTEFTLWDVWVIPTPTDWESYRLSELITDLKVSGSSLFDLLSYDCKSHIFVLSQYVVTMKRAY
ncbi:Ubiquitin modifier-activating enzyme 6 [Fasciolopsis buskii]|uniref:Ubiquitin modifier-activating enzyme 6 n=1 Tax=Fasciolopsis buskii TaxID=27845 RepID=A0A8E0RY18_9TREM|nr:Ubiquitin modifier-activating enzyme 6 [Fasciolopsis buski]